MTDHTNLIARLRSYISKSLTPQLLIDSVNALEALQAEQELTGKVLKQYSDTCFELRAEVERKAQYGKEWMDKYLDLRERLTALESQEVAAWGMQSNGRILDVKFPEGDNSPKGAYTIPLFLAAGAAPKEPKHKYELELPDGDTRKAKVWWTERETNDGALIHKLSISVDETPSTIQAAPTKEQT